ncbi:gamma-glutamyl kinase [Phaeobacter inhibens]|uniref:gamma-glutamyl kinase n=1 Tax=Phaeobacter inhibens TaxID=221822 RepID=UPI00276A25A7|nr:gamma-glutamyl kinase [Phaeobacter inhibens]GLO70496.1 gamma-glutamyl kinase [Phaeobacter inhibens]
MLIFFKERLALLSVPKTGTTAYQAALSARADMVFANPPQLKHAPVYRYNRWIRPMLAKVCNAEMELVAVMREPVSWLGSWYRFRQRDDLRGHTNSTLGISFDDFLRDACKGKPPPHADVGSQAKFLEAQPNGCAVSHLFRYEDPNALHGFLKERLQTEIDLPRLNVSPQADLAPSSAALEVVRRKRADEFALYASLS